jgi:hypothetical protein
MSIFMIKSMKSMLSIDFSYDVTVFFPFFPVFDATKKSPWRLQEALPLAQEAGDQRLLAGLMWRDSRLESLSQT